MAYRWQILVRRYQIMIISIWQQFGEVRVPLKWHGLDLNPCTAAPGQSEDFGGTRDSSSIFNRPHFKISGPPSILHSTLAGDEFRIDFRDGHAGQGGDDEPGIDSLRQHGPHDFSKYDKKIADILSATW